MVVLEESILRRFKEHKREEARYHMENMRLLHELSESERSVLSLAVTVKDLQVIHHLTAYSTTTPPPGLFFSSHMRIFL